ncbi:unnamed protein product [Sphagnum troendelagicum]|uniref:Uncharacterized protein n=1 Tax=Sphagnum troendelagicum TaxID=128251 RepID=A0ABP0TEQ4_9BRYO
MVEKRSAKNLSLKTGLQIINFNGADEQPEVSMEGNHLDLGVLSVALMADGLMKHVHNSRLHWREKVRAELKIDLTSCSTCTSCKYPHPV